MSREHIESLLMAGRDRFIAKSLFGSLGDSFSMRIPGKEVFLLVRADTGIPEAISLENPGGGTPRFHARLYHAREDTGALLVGSTPWCTALASLKATIPVLFDEQARHIGSVKAPVPGGDINGLEKAIGGGANIAIIGEQRLCLGVTPERIVLNAELFEKCAKAFVIAYSSGQDVRRIPWWVRLIAGRRLKKDQARAAESLAAGHIPEGMNAY